MTQSRPQPNSESMSIFHTYVDEVALAVQHDVAVVSVFDLQQEQQEAVGSHAADEVIPSLWRGEEDIGETAVKFCLDLLTRHPCQNCE